MPYEETRDLVRLDQKISVPKITYHKRGQSTGLGFRMGGQ